MARVMALDVGDRRIGVALSDPTGLLASPLTWVERRAVKSDVAQIAALATDRQAERIIVGLPLLPNGDEGPQAARVRRFAEALQAASPLPVELWDERYSTVDAESLMREAGRSPSRERGRSDAAAAARILQSYLEARRTGHGGAPASTPDNPGSP